MYLKSSIKGQSLDQERRKDTLTKSILYYLILMGSEKVNSMATLSWKQFPLTVKLTTAITIAIITAVAGVTGLSLRSQKDNFQQELQQKAELLLDSVSLISTENLENHNFTAIQHKLSQLNHRDLILSAKVYDEQGQLVAETSHFQPLGKELAKNFIVQDLLNSHQKTFIWQSDRLLARKEVIADNHRLGAVTLELSTASLATKMAIVRDRGILVALISSSVGILLALWLARSITEPLHKITMATQKMAQGDFQEPIIVSSQDEIALLAHSFNTMGNKLQALITSLQNRAEELRQSQIKNHALLNAIPDLMWRFNSDGTLIDTKIAPEHHSLTAELLRKNVTEIFPRVVALRFQQSIEQALTTKEIQVFEYEWFVERRRRYFEARIVVCGQNEVLAIIRDNTDSRIAQEELKRAREAAEAASIAKSKFLANMSHELRTPLNGILGLSDLLLIEAKESGYTDFVPDLAQIQQSGTHLLTLIEDILDISKIEADKASIYPERFDITTLICEIRSLTVPMLRKNANTLQIEENDNLGVMFSDRKRVKQILFNILSNAAKFTHEGIITISVTRQTRNFLPALIESRQLSILHSSSEIPKEISNPITTNGKTPHQGSDWIVFKVSDTGIGMTPKQVKNIFQPFIQADIGTTKKYGGTGLGLTICQSFCEMMGGNIAVESELGNGSTFTFWLPATIVKSPEI